MNFIHCVVCGIPITMNGDEEIVKCSVCGAKMNAGLIKTLFALSTKAGKKRKEYNLFKNQKLEITPA